uniref:Uncharacterized protein n=1 Tax=Rhizophora mucronata TaxID=61149 RepID=A0A2P2P7H0_RHIMU
MILLLLFSLQTHGYTYKSLTKKKKALKTIKRKRH